MTGFDINGLSETELELLRDYLSNTHEGHRDSVARVLTTEEMGTENPFGAGLPDVLHYIEDSITTTDREVLRLDDMRRSLKQSAASPLPDVDLPDDAEITPEMLHWLSIHSELTSYYSQVGALIEEFSTDLIMDEVVDDDRQSNRVNRDIENKSQYERGWLLFITGVIDSGEWDEIRTTYQRRNDLVHGSVAEIREDNDHDVESDIIDAWESVNLLHEKLYGLKMEHRISEKLLGNDF